MITNVLAQIFGTANDRAVKQLQPLVDAINNLETRMKSSSDEQLQELSKDLRQRVKNGQSLDEILPEAYALAREAAWRVFGMRPFDVQLMGAIVLHQGKISEMKTGEGKTLTATLALYLNALSGKGSHLVTVNDYLAKRDAQWARPFYEFLGLSVAVLTHDLNDIDRKNAYNSDILYATNNELGFDYLRDNMKFRYEDYVQRKLNFAIIDECDSILIDEARTPLIISGGSETSSNLYTITQQAVSNLERGVDYELDEKERSVLLTEVGHDKVEKRLRIANLYAIENISILHHIMQALKANIIFKRDFDYVVRDGEVLIVDEFTGRILSGRRYSDGLHQAIEAKEDVQIEKETQTLASITLQNFFRLYTKLAGMTGTAMTEAEEFMKIYRLDVVAIPTNKKMQRLDKNDLIFLTERAKFAEIAKDVIERHKKGQPVLIGTVAVEKSERLSDVLTAARVPHNVLNAKNHAREAEIIAHAGNYGAVTIATNMAGRGTDIKLNPESIAAGGLYVLGTERHESRRIDNQLRGRSGRQGDPGESRFYISLEDDLIRIFAGDSMKTYMQRAGMAEDEQIESRTVSKLIERSQEKVEKHNFEIRKHLIEYDDVLNQHRHVIFSIRQDVLKDADQIYEVVRDFINAMVQDMVAFHCPDRMITPAQCLDVVTKIVSMTGLDRAALEQAVAGKTNSDDLERALVEFLLKSYAAYRDNSSKEVMQRAEKWLMLETIDQAWKQHMVNIDHLKEGIGLRGWGQKNPLIEYKRESYIMFEDMMRNIRADIVHHIFHLKPEHFNSQQLERKREKELEEIKMISSSDTSGTGQPAQKDDSRVGRNDDCSCNSGKKYKKCCGQV
ncbi:preprotein translocase subunit SecA [Candidatus Chromulinivorax destructor]|uniref:Protein translocase subunit SecA n=1 Tax=Candidatus Chromulinivorax destructor TaxID=2066483 RepID=A0A345ZBL9_9BACT|nr:preprotein translocase subunit SecA [Candidatus Chromulinivorax destructor]AXK60686.1 preprotein translocase subunit SecA [Candidatus Chromulinivorax destructor]